MEFDKQIGANIRRVRKVRGLSMQDLSNYIAKITGEDISPSMIGMWERGDRRISGYYINILCKALGCTPNLIFPEYDTITKTGIMQEFNALPDYEQQIMEYAATKWNGDMHALINFVGLYMQLSPEARSNVAFSTLCQYQEEVGSRSANSEIPGINIEYATKKLHDLQKKC